MSVRPDVCLPPLAHLTLGFDLADSKLLPSRVLVLLTLFLRFLGASVTSAGTTQTTIYIITCSGGCQRGRAGLVASTTSQRRQSSNCLVKVVWEHSFEKFCFISTSQMVSPPQNVPDHLLFSLYEPPPLHAVWVTTTLANICESALTSSQRSCTVSLVSSPLT